MIKRIYELLEQTGIPVAYRMFRKPQKPPYICYLVEGSDNFMADGIVYCKINRMQIELYVQQKSIELEDKVEEALTSFCWEKTEAYIESEDVYQIIYEIEV